jgi:hypothetical protein
MDTVRDHLETIGLLRLNVRNAAMKGALTLIAWNGEAHLTRQSPTGTPSGAQIVELCKQLETVERVVDSFRQLETDPKTFPNVDELLAQGIRAVQGFAFRLADAPATPGGNAKVTGYVVDTQLLSGPHI